MSEAAERCSGRIKWYNSDRGYGFIRTADAREFFAHVSQVQGDYEPLKGDAVEFSIDRGKDGRPFARRIVIKSEAAS